MSRAAHNGRGALADELDHGNARLASGRRATLRAAALINGAASHSVEFDDIYREPPDWYRGARHDTFAAHMFVSDLSRMSQRAGSAMSSSPESSVAAAAAPVALQHHAPDCSFRHVGVTMPALMLPAVQVNIRAGALPEAEANGIRYLKVPLDRF